MGVASKAEEERRKVGTSEVADKRIVEPPPLTWYPTSLQASSETQPAEGSIRLWLPLHD